MALNGYTKCITGATLLLVLLGTSFCEGRRLRTTTVVNGSLNRDLIPGDVLQSADDALAAALSDGIKGLGLEDEGSDGGFGGSFFTESVELGGDAPPGRKLFAEVSEEDSEESTVVTTSGSGSTTTTSKTRVAVSPGSKGSAGATFSTSATAGTTSRTSRGRAHVVVPERRTVVSAGVRTAHDERRTVPREAPAKAMESEVARTKEDSDEVEEPVVADKGSHQTHLSGGQVSIDLGVSSSSGTTRITTGSSRSGRGSASGRVGASVTTTKRPHDVVVPVPSTVETGDEH